ncbi:MAG: HAMP domain-containing protein [Bacteroidetes bacterium]|nr:HAMP domain-containing protein [Bacteroidota bacterium]
MKLVYKIILAIVVPTAIISVIFIYFIHNILYKEVEQRFLLNLETSTENYATLINVRLSNVAELANYTANKIEKLPNPGVSETNEMIIENIVYDSLVYGSAIFFDTTFLGDLRKSFLYAYREENEIKTVELNNNNNNYNQYFSKNQDWLTIPKNTKKGIWTSPYFDEGMSNTLMITYSAPFFVEGKFAGVTTVDVQIKDLKKLLLIKEQEIEGDYDPDLYIINTTDSLFIYSEREDIVGGFIYNEASSPKYSKENSISILDSVLMMKTGSGIVKDLTNEETFFAFYAPVNCANWMAINIISTSKTESYVNESINTVILYMSVFIGIIVALIYFASKIVTKPISKLSDLTVAISKGNYSKEIDIKRNDEIGTLANNFNHMINEVEKRESALQQSNTSLEKANIKLQNLDNAKNDFLQLISHEIRTPLNGIVGSTYFLDEMIVDPELKDFVEMLKESVDRLDHFSKMALNITQLQTMGDKLELSPIVVIDIIEKVIDELHEEANNKKLSVIIENNSTKQVLGDNESLQKSFYEIVKNGIEHSNENEKIIVNISDDGDKVAIAFTNKGNTIDPTKIDEINEPFILGKNHYDKSTGLGLAYVQLCLNIHKANMKIDSNKIATTFTLIFDAKS